MRLEETCYEIIQDSEDYLSFATGYTHPMLKFHSPAIGVTASLSMDSGLGIAWIFCMANLYSLLGSVVYFALPPIISTRDIYCGVD